MAGTRQLSGRRAAGPVAALGLARPITALEQSEAGTALIHNSAMFRACQEDQNPWCPEVIHLLASLDAISLFQQDGSCLSYRKRNSKALANTSKDTTSVNEPQSRQ